ncbi:DNA cytosine methyltransferase [Albibacterium profundi]|uniref:DNA (cytosine-5-)-methyltransferase n=1 Tax=Albibacterium profundi TaxID=3134906 RepID=A0ABV5CEV8_9SPHI
MINLFIANTKKDLQPIKVKHPEAIRFIYIDLFCGAGGTTTGIMKAKVNGKQVAIVAACVNHDHNAIKSHWLNHPEVVHFEEDIRELKLTPLVDLIEKYREMYPWAKIVLWASLECTNFSKAKGGQPRDADSRTLAEHLYRYVSALNPDYIQIENVVEFMSWGPLDANGKPVSRKNGSEWLRWREHINSFGYYDEWREMNSADFGSYTSRNRLFGCFAKDGSVQGDQRLPIVWPEPTHSNNPERSDLFGNGLKKWKAVKEVLDFDDEGISIFKRKKPLSPKTLERIYAGLVKYVAGGKEAFMIKWNSMSKTGKYVAPSVDDPCSTVTTQNRLGMAFITKYFSGRPEGKIQSVDRPSGAIKTKDSHAPVFVSFLAKYYGNGDNVQSTEEPAGTLTTKDRFSKIQAFWLDKQYSGDHNHQSVDVPAGAILTNDKHSLVNTEPFIMNTSFGNVGKSINEPAPTLLASRRHHYIINPSHGGHSTSTEKPCPVIIARQDKAPLYLTQTICGSACIPFYDDEPEVMHKIKSFMIMYEISDIKMRMLKVPELIKIQGFPSDYKLFGNQSEQKKFIGNSVEPNVPKQWVQASAIKLNGLLSQ